MDPTFELRSAAQELEAELRPIEGFPCITLWAMTVAGDGAFSSWERLRRDFEATRHRPIIVNSFGEAYGGATAELERLCESARMFVEQDEENALLHGLTRTPDEALAAADACSFEEWLVRRRSPAWQEKENRRMAAHFAAMPGGERIVQIYNETADRWAKQGKWKFTPDAWTLPPEENRSPPQQFLDSIRSYDSDSGEYVTPNVVELLLVPCRHSWEVPACLSFSTWEDRPPHVHVAALKWLHARFGAELIGVNGRILEVIPRRRPESAAAALRDAVDLTTYSSCPITSSNENASPAELAVYLAESPFWTFCWP